MELQLLRHATLVVSLGSARLLVDPMFSPAGAADPIRNTPNQRRNPLVDLPYDESALQELIGGLQGIVVTHKHFDHWDKPAQAMLPKGLPVFCQPEDSSTILEAGFGRAMPVENEVEWNGIRLQRTGGRHGTGEVGRRMGPVSGFVLRAEGEPVLYIAGDTIWCPEVAEALEQHQPDVVVVNAGAAQFLGADPITMTATDVLAVCDDAPGSKIVAVHMEAINHCVLSRAELSGVAMEAGLSDRLYIPSDGESITL